MIKSLLRFQFKKVRELLPEISELESDRVTLNITNDNIFPFDSPGDVHERVTESEAGSAVNPVTFPGTTNRRCCQFLVQNQAE